MIDKRHIFSLLPIVMLLACTAQATVTLPIEVMGPEGTVAPQVTVNVPTGQSAGVTGLWLQIHNLSYEYKGSVQVNSGPWIALATPNIQFVDQIAVAYGGIGGFPVLKIIIPLPAGTVMDGNNTINFRFDHTDGFSSGYRIVQFNFVTASGAMVLPASTFVNDDPSQWTAPAGGDPAHGQTLWQTANLTSPFHGGTVMRAKCMDCHARDGGDLKYFNYSNFSIEARAQFHNLSAQDGLDLAAYIRRLNVYQSVGGRPWNPPFQPGQGTSSKNVLEWDAGAGIDAVLPSDEAMIPYLLPNGSASSVNFTTSTYLEAKDIPLNFPLQDWNHYLPKIHPVDSWGGSFLASKSWADYQYITANLKPNDPTSLNLVGETLRTQWPQDDGAFITPLSKNANWGDPTMAIRIEGFKLWDIVKRWEFNHEDGVEGMARGTAYPVNAPSPWAWQDHEVFFVASPSFSGVPENLRGQLTTNGQLSTGFYLGMMWYQLQLIVDDGDGTAYGTTPIDWGYSYNFVWNNFGWAEQQAHGALMTLWLVKGLQSREFFTPICNAPGVPQGTYCRELAPTELEMTVPGNPLLWSQMSVAHRQLLLNNYLSGFLTMAKGYTASQIYGFPYCSQTVDFTQESSAFTKNLYNDLPQWRMLGVDPSILANFVSWASGLWPSVDWNSELNADCVLVNGSIFSQGVLQCTPSSTPPVNELLTVLAGYANSPQPVILPDPAYLTGIVHDEGPANPSGAVTQTWSQVSGPGTVTFGDPIMTDTTATFSQPGTYTLQLTASGSAVSSYNKIAIQVEPAGSLPLEVPQQVAVTPGPAMVAINQTQQFTASVYDQFNQLMTPTPPLTWGVSSAAEGTVNANGLFTAAGSIPAGGKTFQVTTTAGGGTAVGASSVTLTSVTPPKIQLTSPTNNATYTSPATINWQATVTPGANPISLVQFFVLGSSSALQTFANPTSNSFTYSWPNVQAGSYLVSAIVTDNQGLTDTAQAWIMVTLPAGNPPTVVTPVSATPNPVTSTTTALSVLGADDAGESTLTYTWTAAGPGTVTFSVNGTNASKNTTAVFNQPGLYNFQVLIEDLSGLSAPSNLDVNVNQTLKSLIVSPPAATVEENTTLQFSAAAKDQFGNAMSPVPTFTWAVPAPAGTVNGTGLFTASSLDGGPFNLTASADGVTSASVPVIITSTMPPTIALTSPVDGTNFPASAMINLAASVTKGTNPISKVQFYQNGILLNTDTTSPYSYSWTNAPAGTYQITAVVTDTQGLMNTSNLATVTVSLAAPVITQQPQNQTVGVGQTATFTVAATGTNLSYQWQYWWQNNWVSIPGATSNSYSLSDVQLSQSDVQYWCVVSNSAETIDSAVATLTVTQSIGTLPAINQADLPVSAGLNDSLSITNYPDQNATFVWTFAPAVSGNPSAAPEILSQAATASFRSGAKTESLMSYGLQPGTYLVTVQAVDGSNTSPLLTQTITLVSVDLSGVRVYPNPWRSDKHAAYPQITFDQLPLGGTVKIFTVSGHLVKTITPDISTATWDLATDSGDKVASGIYIYLITKGETGYGGSGQIVHGKLAVIK